MHQIWFKLFKFAGFTATGFMSLFWRLLLQESCCGSFCLSRSVLFKACVWCLLVFSKRLLAQMTWMFKNWNVQAKLREIFKKENFWHFKKQVENQVWQSVVVLKESGDGKKQTFAAILHSSRSTGDSNQGYPLPSSYQLPSNWQHQFTWGKVRTSLSQKFKNTEKWNFLM